MLIGLIIIILLLAVDQVTKYLAFTLIAPGFTGVNRVIIPYFLELSYFENPAASLGMLGDFIYKDLVFFAITIIALIIFGYLFTKVDFKKKKTYSIAVVLFIAGTLGNAVDRVIHGFVIDFLHYPFFDFLYRIGLSNFSNNMADNFLTFGIVLFAIDLLFLENKRKEKVEVDDFENN